MIEKQFYASLMMTDPERVVLWDEMTELQQQRAQALFRSSMVPMSHWVYALTRDRCRIVTREKLREEDLNDVDR